MGVGVNPLQGFIQAQDSLNLFGQTSVSQIHYKSPEEIRLLKLDESAVQNGVVRVPYGITEVCTGSLPAGISRIVLPESVTKVCSNVVREPERSDWYKSADILSTKGIHMATLYNRVRKDKKNVANFRDIMSAVVLEIESSSKNQLLNISDSAFNVLLDESNKFKCSDRIETLHFIRMVSLDNSRPLILQGGKGLRWLSPRYLTEFNEIDLSKSVHFSAGALETFLIEGSRLTERVATGIKVSVDLFNSLSCCAFNLLGIMFTSIDFI